MTLVTLGNKIAEKGRNVKGEKCYTELGDVDFLGHLSPITTRHPTATTLRLTGSGKRSHDDGLTDGVEGMAS